MSVIYILNNKYFCFISRNNLQYCASDIYTFTVTQGTQQLLIISFKVLLYKWFYYFLSQLWNHGRNQVSCSEVVLTLRN